jgi:hypothetical protein
MSLRSLFFRTLYSAYGAFSLLTCVATAQFPGSLTNGLINYYSFQGNANDSVGGANGTVIGATLTNNRFGQSNAAYFFDGITAYIDTPASFASSKNAKSFSLWMSPSSIKRGWIIDGGANFTSGAFGLFIESDPNGVLTFHGDGSEYDFGLSQLSNTNLNQWINVVVTYDGTSGFGYINGVEVASKSMELNTSQSNIVIGSRQLPNAESTPEDGFFQGSISDVAIYDRSLSAAEVADLYQAQLVPEPSTYALLLLSGAASVWFMKRRRR